MWGQGLPRNGVRTCPRMGSGSAPQGEGRKTGLNFETKHVSAPRREANTWHGVMEAGGSPGAAPEYKMRHNQQSNPSDLYFNVVTC